MQIGQSTGGLGARLPGLLYWVPPLAWMAGIFGVSSLSQLPSPSQPLLHQLFQGVAHLVLYGMLMALLWQAIERSWPGWRAILWSLLVGLLYAIGDEYHQSLVPGRHATFMDVMIDVGGMLVAWRLIRWRQARARSVGRTFRAPELRLGPDHSRPPTPAGTVEPPRTGGQDL